MSEQSLPIGAVFLSYASQDADAAVRISEALKTAGVEVWLDRSELRGGDAWDSQIKKQIHDCALFVPLISAHTNARSEGYFRREWKQATRRLQDMADDVAFLVPVVVDDIREADARVPEEFFQAHWTWLPGGETPPAFAQRVRQLLGLDRTSVPITTVTSTDASERIARTPSHVSPRGIPLVRRFGLPLTALLLVLGGGALWYFQGTSDAPAVRPEPATSSPVVVAAPHEKSIAVLPFADMSAAKDQEYMSDGMAEEILNLLAQAPDLKVIARTSSFAFKGQNIEIAEIAKKLNVAHVLEGSVRKSGNKLRITAQLVRASDSTHLWSQSYDRQLDNVFEVQDDIANAIVESLQIKMMGGPLTQREGGTQNLEAYQLYLRAGSALNDGTQASLEDAKDYVQKAINLDPNFGRAWSRMAMVSYYQNSIGYLANSDHNRDVRQYALRALELSPEIAEAHALLQSVYIVSDYDWSAAAAAGQRALALDPNDPFVLENLARDASTFGDHEKAVKLMQMSLERDPSSLSRTNVLAEILYHASRFADAESTLRSLLERQPDRPYIRAWLSRALLAQGKAEEALETLEQEADEGARQAYLPVMLQAAGRRADANLALEDQVEYWASECPSCIARSFAYRGDKDRALQWLERAYQQKDTSLENILHEPLYANLSDDPRFKAFVRDRLKIRQ